MFKILLQLILCWCILYIIASIFSFLGGRLENSIKVNLKTFKEWYYLNPDRYTLGYHTILMIVKDGEEKIQMCNPLEQRKYVYFRNSLKRKEDREYMNQKHMRVLETVQDDIDALKKKVEKEQQEAIQMQSQIVTNLTITQ